MKKKEIKRLDVSFDRVRKDLTDTGRSIWLAGLGAMAQVEEDGRDLFDKLVERGRDLEDRQLKSVDRLVSKTSSRIEDWGDRVQTTFQDGVREVLARVGLPSREDILVLNAHLDELSKKVDKATASAG